MTKLSDPQQSQASSQEEASTQDVSQELLEAVMSKLQILDYRFDECDATMKQLKDMLETKSTTNSAGSRNAFGAPKATISTTAYIDHMNGVGCPGADASQSNEKTILIGDAKMYPLCEMKDYTRAIKDYTKAIKHSSEAESFRIPVGVPLTEEQKQEQMRFYPKSTRYFTVTAEEINIPFDIETHISDFKSQLETLRSTRGISLFKFTKTMSEFHRFSPKDALLYLFNYIVEEPAVHQRSRLVASMLIIQLLAVYGGIDPDNENHINCIKWAMYYIRPLPHVHQLFKLVSSTENIFLDFLLKDLGWKHCGSLAKARSIRELHVIMTRMKYTEYDPCFNYLNLDSKINGKYHFESTMENLLAALDADVFNKYKLDPSLKYADGKFTIEQNDILFESAMASLESKAQIAGADISEELSMLSEYFEVSSLNFSNVCHRNTVLTKIILVFMIKDFTRDPNFEKQVPRIVHKLNKKMMEAPELIPFDDLLEIVESLVGTEVFKPNKDFSLLQKTVLKILTKPQQNVPVFLDKQNKSGSLKRGSGKIKNCSKCFLKHAASVKCIPDEDDIEAWNKFKIGTKLCEAILQSGNTPEQLEKFFQKTFELKLKASVSNSKS